MSSGTGIDFSSARSAVSDFRVDESVHGEVFPAELSRLAHRFHELTEPGVTRTLEQDAELLTVLDALQKDERFSGRHNPFQAAHEALARLIQARGAETGRPVEASAVARLQGPKPRGPAGEGGGSSPAVSGSSAPSAAPAAGTPTGPAGLGASRIDKEGLEACDTCGGGSRNGGTKERDNKDMPYWKRAQSDWADIGGAFIRDHTIGQRPNGQGDRSYNEVLREIDRKGWRRRGMGTSGVGASGVRLVGSTALAAGAVHLVATSGVDMEDIEVQPAGKRCPNVTRRGTLPAGVGLPAIARPAGFPHVLMMP